MRIRSIKPEFWRSEDVTSLAIEDRLLFIALWSYVDDNGVGLDKLAAVAADLFAADLEADAPETFARVSRGLQNLSDKGRIVRYKVAGKALLYVVNWEKHQKIDKPNKPRYSLPDQGFPGESLLPRENVASVPRLEQGNRGTEEEGTGEQGNRVELVVVEPDQSSLFEEAWQHWPRKDSKKRAVEKFAHLKNPVTVARAIVAHGDAHALYTPTEFVPHLVTWLNQERWNDPLPQPRTGGQVTKVDQGRAADAELRRREAERLAVGS